MNIQTLGDLTTISSSRSSWPGAAPGETSLKEVRELMALHGLKIGNEPPREAAGERASTTATPRRKSRRFLSGPAGSLTSTCCRSAAASA